MPINGLAIMTPTSIVSTGTGNSSSINTNGSITFSTCATLSLNGVFTSTYDNYMISCRLNASDANPSLQFRLRSGGTDNSTASSYVYQALTASSTTLSASQTTGNLGYFASLDSTQRDGFTSFVFGPYLSQATAYRTAGEYAVSSAAAADYAGTHNQTTSYDGITFYPTTGTFDGLIVIYGFNQ